jgi:hypothetical protein
MPSFPRITHTFSALLQGALLASVFAVQIVMPAVTCPEHGADSPVASHHHIGDTGRHSHFASVSAEAELPPPGTPSCRLEAPNPYLALLLATSDSITEPPVSTAASATPPLAITIATALLHPAWDASIPAPPPRMAA